VSRVWKTGTVALGNVFKCLFGKHCLHYSALERPRGPFVEPAAPGDKGSSNRWRRPRNQNLHEQASLPMAASQQQSPSASSRLAGAAHGKRHTGLHGARRRTLQATTFSATNADPQLPPPQPPPPFVHAVMVREPLGRFISGYLEASASLSKNYTLELALSRSHCSHSVAFFYYCTICGDFY
jgi:hypothetical protein